MPRAIPTRLCLLAVLLSFSLQVFSPCSAVRAQQSSESRQPTTAQGIELYNQGNLSEAFKVLKKVTKKTPEDADAWYYLGLALYKSGLIGDSGPAFKHGLQLQPNVSDAQAKLSYALILANQSESAMAAAKRAIELGDQSAEPHYTLAEASFRIGDFETAVNEADRTLKIDPRFPPALVTRSLAHYRLQQKAEAAADLEQLLALNPENVDADVWRYQVDQLRSVSTESPGSATATTSQPMTGKQVAQKAQVLSKPEPSYTEAARLAGVEGTVAIRCVFGRDGQVKNMLVIRGLGYGLTTKAVNAAKRIRFTPAQKDGVAVSMYMLLEYHFNLY